MTIGTILDNLDGVEERSYGEWTAHCPMCADGKRRLLVRVDGDGFVDIHCIRRCPRSWILGAAGLSYWDLRPSHIDRPHGRYVPRSPGWWNEPRRYPNHATPSHER